MSFLANILGNLNLSGNWLLILVFLAAGSALGIVMGRNKLGMIIFGGYVSWLIIRAIPWPIFLGTKTIPDANVQVFIFLALILGIFFLAPYSGLAGILRTGGRGKANLWQLGLLGISELGFLASGVISFLPAKTVADLSLLALRIFYEQPMQFVWTILPLLAMLILKRRRSYSYSDND